MGVLESVLAGSVVYALPWVLGTLGIAYLFWLRFGRTYESEVIVVAMDGAAVAPERQMPSAEEASSVTWRAGEVLSVLHGGQRTAVAVAACPPWLLRELTLTMYRFENRPEVPPPPVPLAVAVH